MTVLNWDNPKHRFAIIKKWLPEARAQAEKATSLADVLDAFDYWIPWMIDEIERLQTEVALARERLGPAGYEIVKEVKELRAKLAVAEEALESLANKRCMSVKLYSRTRENPYGEMIEDTDAREALAKMKGGEG